MFDIVIKGLAILIIINFLSTWVYAFFIGFINFCTRSSYKLNVWGLVEKKSKLTSKLTYNLSEVRVSFYEQIICFDLLMGIVGLCILALIKENCNEVFINTTVLSILALVISAFLIRFIVDITRSLAHNNKTGKSEKLEEMEHRLAQLEQQLGDK